MAATYRILKFRPTGLSTFLVLHVTSYTCQVQNLSINNQLPSLANSQSSLLVDFNRRTVTHQFSAILTANSSSTIAGSPAHIGTADELKRRLLGLALEGASIGNGSFVLKYGDSLTAEPGQIYKATDSESPTLVSAPTVFLRSLKIEELPVDPKGDTYSVVDSNKSLAYKVDITFEEYSDRI